MRHQLILGDDSSTDYTITVRKDLVQMAMNGSHAHGGGQVEVVYEIPTEKDDELFVQKIMYGEFCSESVGSNEITVESETLFDLAENGTTPIMSMIYINRTSIDSSPYYSVSDDGRFGNIEFCVRSDFGERTYQNLTSGEMVNASISYSEERFIIQVDLTVGFSQASLVTDAQKDSIRSDSALVIVSTVQVCLCEQSTLACIDINDSPLYNQNDNLNVCVDVGSESLVTGFRDVYLTQQSTGIQLRTADSSGTISPLAFAKQLDSSRAMISTRLFSAFFNNLQNEESTVKMSGFVNVGFAHATSGTRKLESDDRIAQGEFSVVARLTNIDASSSPRSYFSTAIIFMILSVGVLLAV